MKTQIIIQCPSCLSLSIKKNGKKIYGKQNYQCKDCHRQFVHESELTYKGCQSSIDDKIRLMLVRGCSIADIVVIEQVSKYKAWTVMQNDVSRTSRQTFDYLYNTSNANTRFVTYFNTIDNRANFFAVSNQYEKNLSVGARWFGGADDVSRARFTGLGADGNLSYVTFGVGSVFSGNPKHIYDWRKEAGDALMKGGFDNFRYLYNNRPNAIQWDIKQLNDEQTLLQPIHEKYLSNQYKFRNVSSWMTNSENRKYTGKFIKEEQTQPGGINILDKNSRIRYGCKLLGYTEQQGCKS